MSQTCEGGLVPEGAVHVDPGLLPHIDAHYPSLQVDLQGKEGERDVTLVSLVLSLTNGAGVTTSPPTLLPSSHSRSPLRLLSSKSNPSSLLLQFLDLVSEI